MEMPHKDFEFWAWLASLKEQLIGAGLAGAMAYLRVRYSGGHGLRALTEALMCAMFAWFIRDLLALIGVAASPSYFFSVLIGYLGTDYFGGLLRRMVDKRVGINEDDKK